MVALLNYVEKKALHHCGNYCNHPHQLHFLSKLLRCHITFVLWTTSCHMLRLCCQLSFMKIIMIIIMTIVIIITIIITIIFSHCEKQFPYELILS